MTAIKFCGITRQDDADGAVSAGANALGFVLWPGSPRAVSADTAARIVRTLPPFITPVAVFVSPTNDELRRGVEQVGCRVVQIHGAADDDGLAGETWQVLRAVHLGDVEGEVVPPVKRELTVLLDAFDPARPGGTGQTIDWARAAAVAARRRVVLAGGLTPLNVAAAVCAVRPYGVDVASGVESAPGIKDQKAMKAFVDAVRSVA